MPKIKSDKPLNFYIYKMINIINGKVYVGQRLHPSPNEDTKYTGSGILFARVKKKYGLDNFKKVILQDGLISQKEADLAEEFHIKNENSLHPNGYNLLSSANRPVFSDYVRKKISDACKGEKNGFYGRKHSDKFKELQSERMKGKKPWNTGLKYHNLSEEEIQSRKELKEIEHKRIEEYRKTDEYKEFISKAHRGRRKNRTKFDSEEFRELRSEATKRGWETRRNKQKI